MKAAKILGLVNLERKLNRLPKVAKDEIKKAMEQGADEIVALMKSLVPISADGSHGNAPGTLRDSIGWTWGKAPKGSSIIATAVASIGGELTITIYAGSNEAFYAWWQELGTQKMTKQPYFFVSWRASKNPVLRRIRAASRKSARKVAAS